MEEGLSAGVNLKFRVDGPRDARWTIAHCHRADAETERGALADGEACMKMLAKRREQGRQAGRVASGMYHKDGCESKRPTRTSTFPRLTGTLIFLICFNLFQAAKQNAEIVA